MSDRTHLDAPLSWEQRTAVEDEDLPQALQPLDEQRHCLHEGSAQAPRVETVQANGRITRILITCPDGNELHLRCHYDD